MEGGPTWRPGRMPGRGILSFPLPGLPCYATMASDRACGGRRSGRSRWPCRVEQAVAVEVAVVVAAVDCSGRRLSR